MRQKNESSTAVARLVRIELARLDKTQGDLAAAMKVDQSILSAWLRGGSERRVPPPDLLDRLAKGLDALTHEQKGNTIP